MFHVSDNYIVFHVSDIPLSYHISEINIDPAILNSFEFSWEPNPSDVGIFIKVALLMQNRCFIVSS